MARRSMAFSFIPILGGGDLNIVLHTSEPPAPAEWSDYMATTRKRGPRILRTRGLVFSDGGGPNAVQRAELADLFPKGEGVPTVFVTANTILRGLVTALSWLNPKIKSFSPEETEAAFKHIGVSAAEVKDIWAEVMRLEAQLGVSLRATAAPSLRAGAAAR